MGWLRFFRRSQWDRERREELESYIAIETDDNIARGMAPDDARAAAVRKLGNATLRREEVYDMNTIGWFDSTIKDLQYGARVLFRQPVFMCVAILSLALGIGANTAIFQLVDTVRLRTLPVKDPASLVRIGIDAGNNGRSGHFTTRYAHLTYGLYQQVLNRQQSFTDVAAWGQATFDVASSGESQPIQGLWVSGNFFTMLGVAPAAGQLIGPANDTRGCEQPIVTLSHAYWQRHYGGSPEVVGRTITLDGQSFAIGGVSEAKFFGVEVGRQFDVALPLCAERQVTGGPETALTTANWWWLGGLARLRPGVSMDQATADMQRISPPSFAETVPSAYTDRVAEHYRAFKFQLRDTSTGYSVLRTEYEQPLSLLLGLAGLVLLIACGNLANLLLARANARQQEMAVRLAIGASRWRLVRQLMAESLLLAAGGAALGAWFASSLTSLLVAIVDTERQPLVLDLSLNWRVLLFTAGLGVLTCLVFGLLPALKATRTAPVVAMRTGGRGIIEGRGRFTLRRGLVAAQLAVSLVLVVGALLFARTFWNLASADVGFTTDGIVAVDVDTRRTGIAEEALPLFYDRLREHLQGQAGIAAVAHVAIAPMSGGGWNDTIKVNGTLKDGFPWVNQVSDNTFALLDIPLRRGRLFDTRDTVGAPRAAVVNEAFVAAFMKDVADPLGAVITFEDRGDDIVRQVNVVGIVADTYYNDVHEGMAAQLYLSTRQPEPGLVPSTLLVRADRPDRAIAGTIAQAASQFQQGLLVTTTPLRQPIEDSLSRERVMATLSTFFGFLAITLAAVGFYGVMAYTVAQRRQEIGIRMALGAKARGVAGMVLREALILILIGTSVGVGLALLTTRWAASLLFGLAPNDPLTFATATAVLMLAGGLASLIPAWRAATVDPTTALRQS